MGTGRVTGMRTSGFWLSLLVVSLVLAGPAASQEMRLGQPNAARFPEVTLYAYPLDARGVMVGGLDASSFRVLEDGKPAQILGVTSSGGSIDVCLALDRSLSMLEENKIEYAKAAAREFIAQLGPDDQAAVITFADGSTLDQPLTKDRAGLLAAIDRAYPSGTTTTFRDAVYWAIAQVALRPQAAGSVVGTAPVRPDARRIVVALTDGLDLSSRILPQELLDYAQANGVSLCMVALGQDAAGGQMEYLARQTGGMYLPSPSPRDLQRLYVALAEQLRREYRITIRTPRPEADGRRRAVRVETTAAPLSAETWYQAPGVGSLLVTVPSAPGAAPGVAGSASPARPGPGGVLGLLLMGAGVAAALTALFLWLGLRGRRLPMADSNPRIDLLPLWVRDGRTRVGRGAECELVLDSQQVSRVHATIEAINGAFRLVDEGSINGTFVNGRRVRGSRPLRIGDVIRFGDREFRFAGEMA